MRDLEIRHDEECRVSSTNGKKLKGYAIRFNSLSQDLGGFKEIISPEAVDRTLSKALDVRALVDHDSGKVIGRTRAGTLVLTKDSKGLRVEIDPDEDISYARDIMRSVARGDISGMSFGFRVHEDTWDYDAETPIRTVLDMSISEVSVVAFPAYLQPNVEVAQRSLREYQESQTGRSLKWLTYLQRQRAS